MAQWITALVALPDDLVSIPSTQLITACNSSSRRSDTLIQTQMQANTNVCKIKIINHLKIKMKQTKIQPSLCPACAQC